MVLLINMCELVFVDVQGFKNMNKFILKEVYINIQPENVSYHALIDSPYSFCQLSKCDRRQVNWLTKNYHGIEWMDGDISIHQFVDDVKLMLEGKTILCKGFEKMQWIKDIFKRIHIEKYINCEDIDCGLRMHEIAEDFDYIDICMKHKGIDKNNYCVCALKNVMKLKRWYFESNLII